MSIKWDNYLSEIYETDLDGHGTREGLVYGTDGSQLYSATALHEYPFDGPVIVEETTIRKQKEKSFFVQVVDKLFGKGLGYINER